MIADKAILRIVDGDFVFDGTTWTGTNANVVLELNTFFKRQGPSHGNPVVDVAERAASELRGKVLYHYNSDQPDNLVVTH